jgi:cell division protein FtsB
MTTPKRDIRILVALVLSFCLIFAITYTNRLARKSHLEVEIAQWEAKIEQSAEHRHALEAELAYVQSDAYIEQLAHDELGLAKEGEVIAVVIPATQQLAAPTAPAVSTTSPMPFWRQWLERLGFSPVASE